jgi:hypothetical protein
MELALHVIFRLVQEDSIPSRSLTFYLSTSFKILSSITSCNYLLIFSIL